MARCEDFPCCGHELGCCPDFDESGKQLNMKCTCGATVPLGGSSLCSRCLMSNEDGSPDYEYMEEMGMLDDREYDHESDEEQDGTYDREYEPIVEDFGDFWEGGES